MPSLDEIDAFEEALYAAEDLLERKRHRFKNPDANLAEIRLLLVRYDMIRARVERETLEALVRDVTRDWLRVNFGRKIPT